MTDLELTALLDGNDSLVKSCVDSALPFAEFLVLYNDFPHAYALDGHEATPEEFAVLKRSSKRIAFHFRIAGVLSGLCSDAGPGNSLYEGAERFAPAVALMRLRELVDRYPDFKAEPGFGS
jgi:hypothetical protein